MSEPRMIDLKDLGVAGELFADAVRRVVENIEDPNTGHKDKRKVTLTFEFLVDDDVRKAGDIVTTCKVQLAGVKPRKTAVLYGRHRGQRIVAEGAQQEPLFDAAPAKPEILQGGRP